MENQVYYLEFIKIIKSAVRNSINVVLVPADVERILRGYWVGFIAKLNDMKLKEVLETLTEEEKFWKLVADFEKKEMPEFSFLNFLHSVFLISSRMIEEDIKGNLPISNIFGVDLLNYSTLKLMEETQKRMNIKIEIKYPYFYFEITEEKYCPTA